MRSLKRLLIIALVVFSFGTTQAQKIGHINISRVMLNMPESRALQADLMKIGKTYDTDIQEMEKKYLDKRKKYEAEVPQQTEEENRKRGRELVTHETRIQKAKQAAAQDLQKKRADGLNPILEKVYKALDQIAKDRGLLYVLDTSQGSSVLIAKGDDLYAALQIKLGLLPDPKPQPAPATKQ